MYLLILDYQSILSHFYFIFSETLSINQLILEILLFIDELHSIQLDLVQFSNSQKAFNINS